MYGKEEKCIQGSWGNLMGKKNHLEDLAADGRTIMDLEEVVRGGMDWINLAYDRYRWRALVKTVMNLWVQKNAANFLTR